MTKFVVLSRDLLLAGLLLAIGLLLTPLVGLAQSDIFVVNDTDHELRVDELVVGGDKLSPLAWKAGAESIAGGTRESVLRLKREGKVNWMDPTPRFIEPGKTATFSIVLSVASPGGGTPPGEARLVLSLSLTGTGSSSKLKHSLVGVTPKQPWSVDTETRQARWEALIDGESTPIEVSYRAYKDNGKTHIEYVVAE